MPNFRRYYVPDALVFITTVVRGRNHLFADGANADLLLSTMRNVQQLHPFTLLAYVLMPDHIHFLMQTGTTIIGPEN